MRIDHRSQRIDQEKALSRDDNFTKTTAIEATGGRGVAGDISCRGGSGGDHSSLVDMYPYNKSRKPVDNNHAVNECLHGNVGEQQHYLHRTSPQQNEYKENRSMGVDRLAFEKLVRQVDWLQEEVRYIRQSLDVIRGRSHTYEQQPATYRSSYETAWDRSRSSYAKLDYPISTSSYYEHGSSSYPTEPSYRKPSPHAKPRQSYSTPAPISSISMEDRPAPKLVRTYSTPVKAEREPNSPTPCPKQQQQQQQQQQNIITRDSVPATGSSVKVEATTTTSRHSIPGDLTISEIVVLWERGINDIPPVTEWDSNEKLQHREQLETFFKVYYIFKEMCNRDIAHFVSHYTDSTTNQMKSPTYVASLCVDVSEQFEEFMIHNNSKAQHESNIPEKIYTLPRKINGRKVSARDVIQLWQYGLGDVPPIKAWSKSQKFKQQSKISRWKKIVDIFKYQCDGDMKRFEDIYADGHGCLLPVAAITNKFETLYGDELNITSKLMTVPTAASESLTPTATAVYHQPTLTRKRKLTGADDSGSDDFEHHHHQQQQMHQQRLVGGEGGMDDTSSHYPAYRTPPEGHNYVSPPPPLLVPVRSPPKLVKSDGLTPPLSSATTVDVEMNGHHSTKDEVGVEEGASPRSSNDDSEGVSEDGSTAAVAAAARRLSPIIYLLPDTFTLVEAVTFWEKGSNEFPPVSTWTRTQNTLQMDLVLKLEKVYGLFCENFNKNMELFMTSILDENNQEFSIDRYLSKYQDSTVHRVNSTSSMTFDFSHHKTISQSTDALYLLPRKINGRKVNAKDVLQLWYHGLNKIPPVKLWSPQQKAVQQSKISRWKKVVELFEQDFRGDWETFQKHYSNGLGQLLPITAIISKHEEESRTMTEKPLSGPHH